MFNVYFENRKSSIIFPCQLLGCEIAKKYVKFISQPSSFEITNLFQSSYLDSTFSFPRLNFKSEISSVPNSDPHFMLESLNVKLF